MVFLFGDSSFTSVECGRVACKLVGKLASGVVAVHLAQRRQKRIEDARLDRGQVVLLASFVERLEQLDVVVATIRAGRPGRTAAEVHRIEALGARDAVALVLVPFVGLVVVSA